MFRPLPSLLVVSLSSLLVACSGASQSPSQAPTGYLPSSAPPPPSGTLLYRLPVLGTWRVWRTHVSNTHDQAYAFDMCMLDAGGKPHASDGKRNTDWAAYGQPIVADAPGVVAIAVDGVPDNEPGVVNTYDMHGNYVVIDHRNGEFSLMAHLIPGSVRVRPGQYVNTGAELGRCGNSGQSTNPHLHWQVMDNVNAHVARAILQRYLPYSRNGLPYNGMPDRGDIITNR